MIREELAAGAGKERRRAAGPRSARRRKGSSSTSSASAPGSTPRRARELEEFGLLEPRVERGQRIYSETDLDVAVACDTLARYGIAPRHLRAFRTAADRESALLEAIVAPALRARNPERRRAGVEDLQALSRGRAGTVPAPLRAERP